jgi:hypothetical protein
LFPYLSNPHVCFSLDLDFGTSQFIIQPTPGMPTIGYDPKLIDMISYLHSEINRIIASFLGSLPKSKSNKDFWQQKCWDDQALLKGSNKETAKQNC